MSTPAVSITSFLPSVVFSLMGFTVVRVLGSTTMDIKLKEPYQVQRNNYILFDRMYAWEDNGKLKYSGTHVVPLTFRINGGKEEL